MLVEQPLIKAQAKDYVRQTQERLIGAPILQRVQAESGPDGADQQRLLALLDGWRGRPPAEQGYGPGNVVNLLRLLRGDLRGLDLSAPDHPAGLSAGGGRAGRQPGGRLPRRGSAGRGIRVPPAVALSADGTFLVAGTPTGDVRLWRVADRTLLLAAQGHTGTVWGVALSGGWATDGQRRRRWDGAAVGGEHRATPGNPAGPHRRGLGRGAVGRRAAGGQRRR